MVTNVIPPTHCFPGGIPTTVNTTISYTATFQGPGEQVEMTECAGGPDHSSSQCLEMSECSTKNNVSLQLYSRKLLREKSHMNINFVVYEPPVKVFSMELWACHTLYYGWTFHKVLMLIIYPFVKVFSLNSLTYGSSIDNCIKMAY